MLDPAATRRRVAPLSTSSTPTGSPSSTAMAWSTSQKLRRASPACAPGTEIPGFRCQSARSAHLHSWRNRDSSSTGLNTTHRE